MTQEQRRIILIKMLIAEDSQYSHIEIPKNIDEQKVLLRSLMNVRPTDTAPEGFLQIQDEYLRQAISEKGITDCRDIPAVSDKGWLKNVSLWKGDITLLKCDAIANACNSGMLGCFQPMHLCIDNAIHTFAGIQLRIEMGRIMRAQGHEEPTGQAKITHGYNLPARHILHTVGPIVNGIPSEHDHAMLRSCYMSCLSLAALHNLESVAFCCISTGVFGFPKKPAAETAVKAVMDYMNENRETSIKQVIFNVFSEQDEHIYREILHEKTAL